MCGYGDFLDRVGWQAEGGRAPRRGRSGAPAVKGKEARRQRAGDRGPPSKEIGALKEKIESIEAEIVLLESRLPGKRRR